MKSPSVAWWLANKISTNSTEPADWLENTGCGTKRVFYWVGPHMPCLWDYWAFLPAFLVVFLCLKEPLRGYPACLPPWTYMGDSIQAKPPLTNRNSVVLKSWELRFSVCHEKLKIALVFSACCLFERLTRAMTTNVIFKISKFNIIVLLAPHTSGPRDVPRCGALSLLQKTPHYRGGSSRNRC
jgi:hypothetical protein